MLNFFKEFRHYAKISGMGNIARRYFVMNAFDGALTIFGFLIGSYVIGATSARAIIAIGLSTAAAVGMSGFGGALLTEAAERKKELKELEMLLHTKLDKSEITRAQRFATISIAIIDGLSPFFSACIILSPFLLFPLESAYFFAFLLCFMIFFFLGAFLGKIAGENLILSGLKMVVIGLICALISYFLADFGAHKTKL